MDGTFRRLLTTVYFIDNKSYDTGDTELARISPDGFVVQLRGSEDHEIEITFQSANITAPPM